MQCQVEAIGLDTSNNIDDWWDIVNEWNVPQLETNKLQKKVLIFMTYYNALTSNDGGFFFF